MGETRSDSNKISILYAIAEAVRQVAQIGKVVAREKGCYSTSLSRYRLEGLGVAAAVLLGGVAAHMVE
jgi:hypothetical protein